MGLSRQLFAFGFALFFSSHVGAFDFNHGTFWLPEDVQSDIHADRFFTDELGLEISVYKDQAGAQKRATDVFWLPNLFSVGDGNH